MTARPASTCARVNELQVMLPVRTLLLSESGQQMNVLCSTTTSLARTPFFRHFAGTFTLSDVHHRVVCDQATFEHYVPIFGRASILKHVTHLSDVLRLLTHDLEHLAHAFDPVTGVALRLIHASR